MVGNVKPMREIIAFDTERYVYRIRHDIKLADGDQFTCVGLMEFGYDDKELARRRAQARKLLSKQLKGKRWPRTVDLPLPRGIGWARVV